MNLVSLQPKASTSQPTPSAPAPRFGGLGSNAVSQFVTDTVGVWAPKVPFTRTKTQFFEDAFLELVEDAAFYFTVPLVSEYLLAPTFKAITKLQEPKQAIGKALRTLEGPVSSKLIGAKAGTLVGAVAIASGFEYLIQNVKNVISAEKFHTKNFTAVAGLEEAQSNVKAGLTDPVEKAHRRIRQVGGVVAGLLGASVFLPKLIQSSPKALGIAKNVLKHFDFSVKGPFDLSKPVMSVMIATGVVSYLDAARDSLEFKETGTRLIGVVPYLIFGQEVVQNLLGWFHENQTVGKGAEAFKIKDKVRFLNPHKGLNLDPLDVDKLRPAAHVVEDLKKYSLSSEVHNQVMEKINTIPLKGRIFQGVVMGAGMCLLTYAQTRQRFQRQQAQQQAALAAKSSAPVAVPAAAPAPAFVPLSAPVAANPFSASSHTSHYFRNFGSQAAPAWRGQPS